MTEFDINRRRILAALAGTGAATFLGLGYATGDPVRYTKASSQSCDDYTLKAEWRETYTRDGQTTLLEDTTPDNQGSEGSDPAIIHLSDVLPGDRGTVSFKLTADKLDDNASNTVTPTLGFDLTGRAENGINDPEAESGDNDSGSQNGELQNYLKAKIWEDEGLLGVNAFGGNNIVRDGGEPWIAKEQTFESLDGLKKDLSEIDATATNDSASVSVTLRWKFPDSANINETQTDSVTFTLDIGCK